MNHIRFPREIHSGDPVGGKAAGLARAQETSARVPEWFVVLPSARLTGSAADTDVSPSDAVMAEVHAALARIARPEDLFAVRSSAAGEDGRDASFAGQFETVLGVTGASLPDAIRKVWESGRSARLRAYRAERGLVGEPPTPGVVIQRMLRPDAAGVAFGADPVTGATDVAVISSVLGLGNALVSGETDADTHRVRRDGTILERTIAHKERRDVVDASSGTASLELTSQEADSSSITDEQAGEVASLAWKLGEHFGQPQDIEWAYEQGKLWLLQVRPITTLGAERVTLWDNSNIAESYAGVTTPLTFTFARNAYAEVYREMCKILLVPRARVEHEKPAFDNLLGLIDGRMYYNLVSWYRILALLPGFKANRTFMEQMMGVGEELPGDLLDQIETDRAAHDTWAQTRSGIALLRDHVTLERQIRRFTARLDVALASAPLPEGMELKTLADQYRQLEKALLRRWDAPLLNDFFAMIFFGALRKACTQWIGDENGTLQNALLFDAGSMVSAEPPRMIGAMARVARQHPQVAASLREDPIGKAEAALRSVPELGAQYDAYIARFGDRCLQELKLESPTLREDATSLLRTIGEMAARDPVGGEPTPDRRRESAQQQARRALRRSPLRAMLFPWILRNARGRVRDRENLRFERTRVFGRVRRIFAEMGRRLVDEGTLDSASDVFYLELDELLAAAELGTKQDLRARARSRRADFEEFRRGPAPPDRFLMRGTKRIPAGPPPSPDEGGEERVGTGCCPGRVRGPVRVVTDPRGAVVRAGEILVARHTDPGWILLFGACEGLLVEHGSLLSHAAIVSREMGIPCVVGLPGATSWLRDGDLVELDGQTGRVKKILPTEAAT